MVQQPGRPASLFDALASMPAAADVLIEPAVLKPTTLFVFTPVLALQNAQKEDPAGSPTSSAHPARFSPDDKFSKERVMNKKRFGVLLTQSEGLQL